MNAILMKISSRLQSRRHEFKRPNDSDHRTRHNFYLSYFNKNRPHSMPHPDLSEDDDDRQSRELNLYNKYGRHYYSHPPYGHPEHNPEKYKQSVIAHQQFRDSPKNKMKYGYQHVRNAGIANEEMLNSAYFLGNSAQRDENKKEWIENEFTKDHIKEFMYLRHVRNLHFKREVNKNSNKDFAPIGIVDNKSKDTSRVDEQQVKKSIKNKPSHVTKLGLGIVGAAGALYLGNKARKAWKARKQRIEDEKKFK